MSIRYKNRKSKSNDDSDLPVYNLPDFEVRASEFPSSRKSMDVSKPSTKLNDDIKSMESKSKSKNKYTAQSVADNTKIFDTKEITRKELTGSPFKRRKLS
jgi:hypothetical protein